MENKPLQRIIAASDMAELCRHVGDASRAMGFTGFSYHTTIPRVANKALVFHTTSPAAWQACYSRNNYRDIDPQLRYCEREFAYTFWDATFYKTRQEQAIYADACSYGIRGGLLLPIHGSASEVALFSLNTEQHTVQNLRNRIELIGQSVNLAVFFHQAARRLLLEGASKSKAVKLSKQQKNCLRMASEGMTSSLIAEKLGITENTVNSYFKTIFEKLEVSSRNQALSIAMNSGMLV